VTELTSAGFVADALVEPVPDFPWSREYEHVWRIPDFVLIRALPRAAAEGSQ
jgi:hypothetical protein